MELNWEQHVRDWSHPPVDNLNEYVASSRLLTMDDDTLCRLVEAMGRERFEGWRNHNGLWRDVMGLDVGGRRVLDFGCGVGLEALELVRAGNTVDVADVAIDNMALAHRVVTTCGNPRRAPLRLRVWQHWPFVTMMAGQYDTFHCSGVLHHIPWARDIMLRARELLRPGGDVRLMLYSDRGWREATETEPPDYDDVERHPRYPDFVRYFDQVGTYATWYDEAKLIRLFGDVLDIERVVYLTPSGRYLGAVLRSKS